MEKIFFKLLVSSLGGQFIALISYVIVAKNFNPSNYGDYSIAISVASFLIPLATLRVDQRLYSELSPKSVSRMVRIGTFFTLYISAILISISQVMRFCSSDWNVSFQDKLLFIGLITLSLGLSNIYFSYTIFMGQINTIKTWPIKQNLSYLIFIAFFGWISPTVLALVLSIVISRLFPPFLFLLSRISNKSISLSPRINYQDVKEIFNKGKLAIVIALCDQSIVAIPVIGLYSLFSANVAGIASLAVLILQAPSGLISSTITSAIMLALSGRDQKRSSLALDLTNKYIKRQFIIIIIFGTFTILCVFLLQYVNFGKWNGILVVIAAQTFPIYLMTLWIPLSSILQSLGLWALRARIGVFQLILVCMPFIFAKFFHSRWQNFVIWYSLVNLTVILISCYVAYSGIRKSSKLDV